jgi:hypothetical protein
MHFSWMDSIHSRHLVLAYAAVIAIQGGYFLWLVRNWLKLSGEQKKATKPAE